jgi:hypothetical protein
VSSRRGYAGAPAWILNFDTNPPVFDVNPFDVWRGRDTTRHSGEMEAVGGRLHDYGLVNRRIISEPPVASDLRVAVSVRGNFCVRSTSVCAGAHADVTDPLEWDGALAESIGQVLSLTVESWRS